MSAQHLYSGFRKKVEEKFTLREGEILIEPLQGVAVAVVIFLLIFRCGETNGFGF